MNTNKMSWKSYMSPRFIASKVRERGIIYCANWLLKLIWRNTRPARATLMVVPDYMRYRGKKQSGVLYAFYDMEVAPATSWIWSSLSSVIKKLLRN